MDTVESLLKEIQTINMGKEDKTELNTQVKALEDSIQTFVGTKSQVEANEKAAKEQIKKITKEWQSNQYAKMGTLWEKTQRLVEEEENVWDNPKCSKVWSMAWEHGHSAGHHEVVNYFREFCELIK